jgi:hypothetical protein
MEPNLEAPGEFKVTNTAATEAYLAFAWDLFVTQDNKGFQDELVHRMKFNDQFQHARYELFLAATCVKAGYTIAFEDERDRSHKHPEFIATYKKTGECVAIEAKSRKRPGVFGHQVEKGKQANPSPRMIQLINSALKKKSPSLPFVIFCDLNLPPVPNASEAFAQRVRALARDLVKEYGEATAANPEKFNAIVFTNHPVHWLAFDALASRGNEVIVISQFPETPLSSSEPLTDLLHAAKLFGIYPKGFPLKAVA